MPGSSLESTQWNAFGNHPLRIGFTSHASAENPLAAGMGSTMMQVIAVQLPSNFHKQKPSATLPDEEAEGKGIKLWCIPHSGGGKQGLK